MLDTNIVLYTMKSRPERVRDAFKKHEGQMCLSSIALGELVYGAEKSTETEQNLADIKSMISRLEVKPFDSQAAIHFGQIRAALAKIGKPIRPYDAMIAGHARALGLVLVTNNETEFQRVPGLMLENWVIGWTFHKRDRELTTT